MFGIITFLHRAEKGEVPIFGDVPVEGKEGVDEDGDEPVRKRRDKYDFRDF